MMRLSDKDNLVNIKKDKLRTRVFTK